MSGLDVPLALGIAAVFLMVILLILQLFPAKRWVSTVPGLEPSSKQNGNMEDIGKSGSFHEFLVALHKQFGPIASFWWGTKYAVSIASPELFKQHKHHFNRPVEPFILFEPLLTRDSIEFTSGDDGKSRRRAYDSILSHDHLGLYYKDLQQVAQEVTARWDKADVDDQFPLKEHVYLSSVKSALVCLMGDSFKDDEEALAFKHNHDMAWYEFELRLLDGIIPEENSERGKNFKRAISEMREIIKRVIRGRNAHGKDSRDFLLIDAIMDHHLDDDDKRFADVITYTVGGFHTTSSLLTWCIYFLCRHEDVQEKLYQEIYNILGPRDPVCHQSIGKLKYLRQVLDETLRCGIIAPFAARYSEKDTELGGHKIPANTPVIHALGVVLMDENIWPEPTVFDPERFSVKSSKGRPHIAFSPFGFAGGRKCPGYRFAYAAASVFLVTALQKFKFLLVPGQDVKHQFNLITQPKGEIWVQVVKRE